MIFLLEREEHLLQDCEWKLRTTEQKCKAKVVAAELAKDEAVNKAAEIETEAHRQMSEVIQITTTSKFVAFNYYCALKVLPSLFIHINHIVYLMGVKFIGPLNAIVLFLFP